MSSNHEWTFVAIARKTERYASEEIPWLRIDPRELRVILQTNSRELRIIRENNELFARTTNYSLELRITHENYELFTRTTNYSRIQRSKSRKLVYKVL